MSLIDDTLSVKPEFGVYRAVPRQKLGIIAKDEFGQFRFYPSGVSLSGYDAAYIRNHVDLANKFEASNKEEPVVSFD